MSEINSRERYGAKDVIEKPVGVFSVVCIIYCICCAGAFGIEEMVGIGGPGLTLWMLIILPFIWALPYCWIVAEIGSARPVEGGKLMWVKEGLGEFWFGIMVLVNFIWSLIANTVYVVLCIDYLQKLDIVNLSPIQAYIVKLALILIFFIVNILGIKEVSWVSTFISMAVCAVFLLVTIIGFSMASTDPFTPVVNPDYSGNPVMAIGATLGLGIWMYCGYDEISLIGGEVKGAEKVIPKAIIIAIPLIALTYILPTAGGLASGVAPWDEWTVELDGIGYHTILENSPIFPNFFSYLFVFVAILGMLSIYNVCIMAAGRTTMILADESLGFKAFGKLSKKRGMPVIGMTVVIIVTTLLLGTPNHPIQFTFLVLFDAFFAIIVAVLVTASAVVLKRRIPPEEVPFKAPGGKTGHNIMVCLIAFGSLCFALLNGLDYFLAGIGIMLFFPILYCICKWIWKGQSVKDPLNYPLDPRTRLGFGDLTRLGGYYLSFGILAGVGRVFLKWFEEEENTGYWLPPAEVTDDSWVEELVDGYEYDVADFQVADSSTADVIAGEADPGDLWIPGYYEAEYETGLFADFYGMLDTVMYIAIGAVSAGIILLIGGKVLKKNDEKVKAEVIKKFS